MGVNSSEVIKIGEGPAEHHSGRHDPAKRRLGASDIRGRPVTAGRARDRRVYLRSHPVLFALLAATRHRPALRLGRTVLVHDRAAYLAALTRVPLDRTSELTIGGAASRLAGSGMLFDQQGDAHRVARRDLSDQLGAAGVERLRPIWTAVLHARLAPLAAGGTIDLVPVAAELAGATTAALLGIRADPLALATAARTAAATAARAHLPGPGRRRAGRAAEIAANHLFALFDPEHRTRPDQAEHPGRAEHSGRGAMLAVAAINTTVAAVPRAVAWAGADHLWGDVDGRLRELTDELLRVTAATPLLPRVAAADAELRPGGCPVRAGDRLLLVARHAADAHRRDPDPRRPADAATAQLVFGAGPHACPGARLARAQLADVLAALAPYRPVVERARADRRSALPGWQSLIIRAGS
jgi:cytochrome P450